MQPSALRPSNPVLVLSGPTATGKSSVAVEIALRVGGEIVSADSVQLYKELNIGSGKITQAEMRGVPHHCIDVFDASDDIGANSAAGFSSLARSCIDDILARGAVPIVVGGSGMYLSFLLYGPPPTGPPPPAAQPQLSSIALANAAAAPRPHSPPSSDSSSDCSTPARSPHSNDAYRIKRRRDIESTAGCIPPYAGLAADRHLLSLDYNFVCVSMWCDRIQSFRRIDRRVEQMVADGLLAEVLRLYGDGRLRPSSMAARAIGYRHALCFLAEQQHALLRDDWLQEFDGSSACEQPLEKHRLPASASMHSALLQFVSRMQAATRQYSTRQLTWFKGDKRWLWFDTRPVDCKIDVSGCAGRLAAALACDPPSSSPDFLPIMPALTKVEASNLKRYAPLPPTSLSPNVRQRLLLQAREELKRIYPLLDGPIQVPE